jgi:nicotinate-nucleotide pyrophosphorylase (carboxylating)
MTAAEAVRRARDFVDSMKAGGRGIPLIIEVEVDTFQQLHEVLPEQPDIVLLDNMSLEVLRRAVELRNSMAPAVQLEASGGVNLNTVADIARTGVERISVGGLTHSASSLDVGLDWL